MNELNDQFEIDLVKIYKYLQKRFFLIFISSFIIFGVTYFLSKQLIDDIYHSSAILEPVEASSSSQSSGSIQSLASNFGINLPNAANDPRQVAKKVIFSQAFFNTIINNNPFVIESLCGIDSYNKKEKVIIKNQYTVQALPSLSEEDLRKLLLCYRAAIIFKIDQLSGLVEITLKSLTPQASQVSLGLLLSEFNNYMLLKEKALIESNLYFLEQKLSQQNLNPNVKQVIGATYQTQFQKYTMTEINDEYFLRILVPPSYEIRKSEPNRLILCILSFLTSFFILNFFFVFRFFQQR